MPDEARLGRSLRAVQNLADLTDDDELLVDFVVSYLGYHRILADQVGVSELLRQVRNRMPAEIIETIVKKVIDENRH